MLSRPDLFNLWMPVQEGLERVLAQPLREVVILIIEAQGVNEGVGGGECAWLKYAPCLGEFTQWVVAQGKPVPQGTSRHSTERHLLHPHQVHQCGYDPIAEDAILLQC